jgi:hypothetical protein
MRKRNRRRLILENPPNLSVYVSVCASADGKLEVEEDVGERM